MTKKKTENDCFVIMPIGDHDDYEKGHFFHVYQNIIQPACEQANVNPIRADDVKETNLIHLDILKKLIDSPIAICDLSTRNPNVLFELGIRQAFDKPVVLIQEIGTKTIFDITPLRYLEYSKEMQYHDVLQSQKDLKEAIDATRNADSNASINSIVKLMALSNPAVIPDIESGKKETFAFEILQSEMRDMKKMMEMALMEGNHRKKNSISTIEFERISKKIEQITNTKRIPSERKLNDLKHLQRDTERLMMMARKEEDHMYFRNLMERIEIAMHDIGSDF